MRLLFVHEKFGAFAGAEANAWHTANALRQRGHLVGLLHHENTGKGEDAWAQVFSPQYRIDRGNPAAGVAEAVAAFAPDVIYAHNITGSDFIAALLRTGVPIVRMIHDHQLYCMRGYKYHYLNRNVCTRAFSPYCLFPCGASIARDREGIFPFRWVGYLDRKREIAQHKGFHRLVVASNYMEDELVRNGFDSARIEIHPPVPPNSAFSDATFHDRNLIVYAGQIARGKGVDILLESLAQVRVNFECAIIGDGHHRLYCERLCRGLGLGDRVRFHGYLPQDRVAEFYRDASLAVMSSVWPEPFGAVGLEAMRHALPVVAFDAGAIKEWLRDGENGLLAPWMDRNGFAARVESLLRDKTLARAMGRRGQVLLGQRYDFKKYIDGIEHMFVRVAAERAAETAPV